MSPTFGALLRQTTQTLAAAGIDTPGRDARALLAKAAGVAPEWITLMAEEEVPEAAQGALRPMAEERAARRPMAQILGKRAFYRHELEVTPDVLDPRPETEILVDAVLDGPVERLLDLGTGSGAILVSVLAERGAARGVGTDLSAAALEVAVRNAGRLGVEDRATFLRSDWYSAVERRFDLIVSNPPYIAVKEMDALAPELAYEPRMALTDEGDGLSAYRAITEGAGAHLLPGGRLMVEIGWTQAAAVTELFESAGFADVTVLPDLDGRDRVVTGIWR